MSIELLDKTRKIGKLLHNSSSTKVVFNDICRVLTETMSSSAMVISRKGKVLGLSLMEASSDQGRLIETPVGGFIDEALNDRLLSVLSTNENANPATLGFDIDPKSGCALIVAPIDISDKRLGTLLVFRYGDVFDIDDIILCEYTVTVVGLEMTRSVNEETAEDERRKQVVKSAISTLTYSEQEAMIHVFDALDGTEGILVASRIADAAGVARSVIVNALRKFESAGVIESRSSGMKGTYIRVCNEIVLDEIESLRHTRGALGSDGVR